MTQPKSPRPSQGAGELSGLLRKAEALQKELETAQAALHDEVIRGEDANGAVRLEVRGDGTLGSVEIRMASLADRERRLLQEALQAAMKVTLERLFELRRARLEAVTRGLHPPGLFS